MQKNNNGSNRLARVNEELKRECKLMLEVFDDVHNEIPNFEYKIIS